MEEIILVRVLFGKGTRTYRRGTLQYDNRQINARDRRIRVVNRNACIEVSMKSSCDKLGGFIDLTCRFL